MKARFVLLALLGLLSEPPNAAPLVLETKIPLGEVRGRIERAPDSL
jgi:hypothetical protein